jgi:hypothetical protein
MEGADVTASLYGIQSVQTSERIALFDSNTPGPMRAPPEVPYPFALENALDVTDRRISFAQEPSRSPLGRMHPHLFWLNLSSRSAVQRTAHCRIKWISARTNFIRVPTQQINHHWQAVVIKPGGKRTNT